MNLNTKDKSALFNRINNRLSAWGDSGVVGYTRVYIKDASPGLVALLKANASMVNAEIVFVEGAADEANAARARNTNGFKRHTVLIFDESHSVSSYFSSTFDLVSLPKAVLKRVDESYRELKC